MKNWGQLAIALSVFEGTGANAAVAIEEATIDVEEIVVTARRRNETVQNVPASITALSRAKLDRLGSETMQDLTAQAPNLTIFTGSAQSNAASIFIRGIGQRDSLQTFESGVGLYVDGIYFSRMQGSLMRLFDIERVEILRGPQGTLYGKNTVGGAVNIITRDPLAGYKGQAELGFGNYDEVVGSFYAAIPLAEDKAAFSIAARYSRRDGFFEDPVTGEKYQDDNSFSGRAKLAFKANENLKITFAADILEIDISQYVGRSESDLSIVDVVLGPQTVRPAPLMGFEGTVRTSIDPANGQSNTHWGLSATIDWQDQGDFALRSISAYRHMNPVQWLDADGTELEIADVWATWVHEQWSQEFQLAITRGKWDAILGAFLMTEESVAVQETFLNEFLLAAGTPIGFTRPGHDKQEVTTVALYGHSTVDLTDRLELSLGARWSLDDKKFKRVSETKMSGVVTNVFSFEGSEDWSAFTPSLTLDYRFSDQGHLYGKVARGFRSGGYNGRMFSAADAQPFDPEYVWTYELGLKGQGMDSRLRYGLSAFYNDYKDFQARVAVAVDSGDPSAGFNFPTLNAARLKILGAELEVSLDLGALDIWGSLGLLDADYKEFQDAQGDRSSNKPIRAPEVTANIGGAYERSLGALGAVSLSGNVSYVSSFFTSVDNSPLLFEDGYMLVNASAHWWDQSERWGITVGVSNLFDTVYQVDGFDFRSLGNIFTAYYGAPRTWRISLRHQF